MKKAKKPAVEPIDESVHFDAYVARENHKRHVLRWSVVSVAVIMVFLWGFALRNQFVSLTWGKSAEAELVKTASKQWDAANKISEAKNKADDTVVVEAKEKLAAAILAANMPDTVTTGTEFAVTTTEMIATTTAEITTTTTSTTN